MTQKDDTQPLFDKQDALAALGLLSRLPVPVDMDQATARGAAACWAYPLAGVVLAVIAATVGQILLWAGLPPLIVAGVSLAVLVVLTGAMHEDGLADSADGLWGGWDAARRLEIMKDSRIGAYGVLALVFGIGLRWLALGTLVELGLMWPALLAVAVMSRAAMPPLMARLPNARETGLSQSVGRPSVATARVGEAIALVVAVICFGWLAVWMVAAWLLTLITCAAIARAKIGGQTGDILGASQQITEIVLLLTLSALVSA